ncbi:MAG: nucleotidyltransferase substrate binding protein [Gammaproteobacteria bacterium AqS3]|nr:nucleotidyltransferase substrate binding protein [Gammaproteobacteria bacterium AqS3]
MKDLINMQRAHSNPERYWKEWQDGSAASSDIYATGTDMVLIKMFELSYETTKKMLRTYIEKEYGETVSDTRVLFIRADELRMLHSDSEQCLLYRELRKYLPGHFNKELTENIISVIPEFIGGVKQFFKTISTEK